MDPKTVTIGVVVLLALLLGWWWWSSQARGGAEPAPRGASLAALQQEQAEGGDIDKMGQYLPAPPAAPYSAPTWSSRKEWAVPFAVRYAIAFTDGMGHVGPMSDWTPYYTSSTFSNPILSKFPVVVQKEKEARIVGINIYRQFEGNPPILLESVRYPFVQRWIDRHGDDK